MRLALRSMVPELFGSGLWCNWTIGGSCFQVLGTEWCLPSVCVELEQ
jgi:hypothetical protein